MSSPKPTQTPSDKSAAKKAAVLGAEKESRLPLLAMSVTALLVVGGGFFFLGSKGADSQAVAALTPANASASEVSFPLKDFDDGQARFFQLDGGSGVSIRYYAVKAPDGSLKTAYDACDACWASGKGYKQAGAVMICQNCRRKFEIVKIGEIHGGCNPAALKSQVKGGQVVIQLSDIQAGRHYFELPKKEG
ncbi:MAG: DUF2318 domain-containing protein [Deltaproteobacteria bacterium]|nr:DUF2318 domain-containing protein [Deltaproteobacteria bacterium]